MKRAAYYHRLTRERSRRRCDRQAALRSGRGRQFLTKPLVTYQPVTTHPDSKADSTRHIALMAGRAVEHRRQHAGEVGQADAATEIFFVAGARPAPVVHANTNN